MTSLYCNIPNEEGIDAFRNVMRDMSPLKYNTINSILMHNNFEFDCHFLQVSGTAMGTKVAPTYADICMAALE